MEYDVTTYEHLSDDATTYEHPSDDATTYEHLSSFQKNLQLYL